MFLGLILTLILQITQHI
uniref:Uncharacterized protein n=1 Tax=Anguilla anguilla TaxID=7936 RepID=A0A0E9QUE7_ANGAN